MTTKDFIFASALAAALAVATIAGGSSADEASPQRRPPAPTPPPAAAVGELDGIRPAARQGLLREGSHILNARGRLDVDASGNWMFTIDSSSPDAPQFILTLMPNSYLAEAQQVAAASAGQQLMFELSGQVFVYRGRNFLLITHPPRVVANDSPGKTGEVQAPDEPDAAADSADARPRRDAGSVMRDLEREAGPLHRRSQPREVDPEERQRLRTEGMSIVMRRGKVSRDSGGAWVFVFDADATGLADPPMTLLPCLLLQRIESHAQRRGNEPMLISGRVYRYEGRSYLLPTVFHVPREQTAITP